MDIYEILDELQKKAQRDNDVKKALLETRNEPNPLGAFCEQCRKMGYDIYPMDLIEAGEVFHAAMKRSTNGGGENSPKLAGEDDFYELFFAALEH